MKNHRLLIALLASLTLLPMLISAPAQAAPKKGARKAEAKKALEAKPERSLKVFRLQNGSALALTKTIMPLFQGSADPKVVIVYDERTNSIIARGSDIELKVLEALLIQLDEPKDSDKPK